MDLVCRFSIDSSERRTDSAPDVGCRALALRGDGAGRAMSAVLWFRADLRVRDHPALCAAAARAGRVTPLFVRRGDRHAEATPILVSWRVFTESGCFGSAQGVLRSV